MMDRLKLIKQRYDAYEPGLGLNDDDVLWLISRLEMEQSAKNIIKDISQVVTDTEKSQAVKLILIQEIINRYNIFNDRNMV